MCAVFVCPQCVLDVFSLRSSAWGMILATHLHVNLRFRLCTAICLLPLYAFVARTGTTLPFYGHVPVNIVVRLGQV